MIMLIVCYVNVPDRIITELFKDTFDIRNNKMTLVAASDRWNAQVKNLLN